MNRLVVSFCFALLAALTAVASPSVFDGAQWIGATADASDSLAGRSIVLNRQMALRGKVKRATAYVCGLGCYELYVNHSKVSDDIMAPAWSDYNKTLFYNSYDVTSLLSSRRTTISVILGNGFYHEEGKRYHKLTSNYGPLTLLFSLKVDYENGSSATIVSDGQWYWNLSPVTYNSIYGGEDYDARIPMFRTKGQKVVLQQAPKGQLRQQIARPIRIMECFDVSKRLSGMLFDMGQNLAGFPEVSVKGRPGQTITIWVGESLTADGTKANQKQSGKPHFYRLTIGKSGFVTWHPRFSYYSFRYIQVDGAVMQGDNNPAGLPEVSRLQSCFIYNSAPKTGNFECSNERWNKTYKLIDKAIRSNWQHVWTDCPAREKLGWLEQDWLNGPGLVANYDCRSMIEQTMVQIADAQHGDGSMPEIAPEYIKFEGSWAPPFQESPEWGGALVALPYLYQDAYGSDSLIRAYLPRMVRYVDYLASRDSSGILRMGLGDWYDFGPGRAGFSKNTPLALVSTAHYYYWTYLTAKAATGLSSEPGFAEYKAVGNRLAEQAEYIKKQFQNSFYHADKHSYGSGSQASNAIPLYMGIVPDSLKDCVLNSLVADIHAHGNRLSTGDVGTPFLYAVLLRYGYDDLLSDMLDHDSVPGYGFQIKRGMTSLSEQWNPDMGASLNHFMLGHINNHLVPDVVGIKVTDGLVMVQPHPLKCMSWAKGERNGIKVAWHKTAKEFQLSVDMPVDQIVTVIMPYSRKQFNDVKGHWEQSEIIPAKFSAK